MTRSTRKALAEVYGVLMNAGWDGGRDVADRPVDATPPPDDALRGRLLDLAGGFGYEESVKLLELVRRLGAEAETGRPHTLLPSAPAAAKIPAGGTVLGAGGGG